MKEDALMTLEGHTTFVWTVAFSPDGRILASGDNDGVIKVWDTGSGQCLTTLQSGPSPIGALAFRLDGETLLSSSSDETIMLWDMGKKGSGCSRQVVPSQGLVNWTRAMVYNQDGSILAVGGNNHSIKLWHIEEQSKAQGFRTLTLQGGQVWSLAFSPNSRLLASGDDSGTLVLWDVETETSCQVLRSDRPYERMNIQGVKGITQAQRDSLKALGAIDKTE